MNKQCLEAMSKLHKALTIDPTNDKVVWYLEEVHKFKAFLNPDHDEAKIEYDVAFRYFIKAVELVLINYFIPFLVHKIIYLFTRCETHVLHGFI